MVQDGTQEFQFTFGTGDPDGTMSIYFNSAQEYDTFSTLISDIDARYGEQGLQSVIDLFGDGTVVTDQQFYQYLIDNEEGRLVTQQEGDFEVQRFELFRAIEPTDIPPE